MIDNDEQIKAQQQEFERKRERELNDIRKLLATEEGLRFFRRLMSDGFVFKTTFTGNSHGFFNEGHRNLALRYLADISTVAPEMVQQLMTDSK